MTKKTPPAIRSASKDTVPDTLKLLFIEKVEKGLKQLHSGDTVTHAEVKRRIKTWRLH